jgi:CheY-like chemotaxis protein
VGNLRVLIVEDSAAQASVIASLVKTSGHTPVVYTSLPTGIAQILSKEEPDLVLLDLMLLDSHGKQVADGFQVCREVKRALPDTPVIIITAEGDDDACEWAILQGADAFLQKPFDPEELTDAIEKVTGRGVLKSE